MESDQVPKEVDQEFSERMPSESENEMQEDESMEIKAHSVLVDESEVQGQDQEHEDGNLQNANRVPVSVPCQGGRERNMQWSASEELCLTEAIDNGIHSGGHGIRTVKDIVSIKVCPMFWKEMGKKLLTDTGKSLGAFQVYHKFKRISVKFFRVRRLPSQWNDRDKLIYPVLDKIFSSIAKEGHGMNEQNNCNGVGHVGTPANLKGLIRWTNELSMDFLCPGCKSNMSLEDGLGSPSFQEKEGSDHEASDNSTYLPESSSSGHDSRRINWSLKDQILMLYLILDGLNSGSHGLNKAEYLTCYRTFRRFWDDIATSMNRKTGLCAPSIKFFNKFKFLKRDFVLWRQGKRQSSSEERELFELLTRIYEPGKELSSCRGKFQKIKGPKREFSHGSSSSELNMKRKRTKRQLWSFEDEMLLAKTLKKALRERVDNVECLADILSFRRHRLFWDEMEQRLKNSISWPVTPEKLFNKLNNMRNSYVTGNRIRKTHSAEDENRLLKVLGKLFTDEDVLQDGGEEIDQQHIQDMQQTLEAMTAAEMQCGQHAVHQVPPNSEENTLPKNLQAEFAALQQQIHQAQRISKVAPETVLAPNVQASQTDEGPLSDQPSNSGLFAGDSSSTGLRDTVPSGRLQGNNSHERQPDHSDTERGPANNSMENNVLRNDQSHMRNANDQTKSRKSLLQVLQTNNAEMLSMNVLVQAEGKLGGIGKPQSGPPMTVKKLKRQLKKSKLMVEFFKIQVEELEEQIEQNKDCPQKGNAAAI